jgi:hypothetical protein
LDFIFLILLDILLFFKFFDSPTLSLSLKPSVVYRCSLGFTNLTLPELQKGGPPPKHLTLFPQSLPAFSRSECEAASGIIIIINNSSIEDKESSS